MRSASRGLACIALLALASCAAFPIGGIGRAREIAPEARDAVQRARLAAQDEHYEQALDLLHQAVARDPLAIPVQRELQELQVRTLRKDEALREAEERLIREPERAEWLYLRGRLEDDVERQSEWFERALRADPDLGWAVYGLGITALRGGEVARAEELLAEAVRREHDNAEFLLAEADVVRRAGRLAEAREKTLRAAARFPTDVRFALALVAIELEAADRDAAVRQALRALRADPFDLGVYAVFLEWVRADERRIDLGALELELVRAGDALRRGPAPRVIAIAFQRLQAHVAAARGHHEAAWLAWRRARSAGAHGFLDFEAERRAHIRAGLYADAYRAWAAAVPPGLLAHPAQRFRDRWSTLEQASRAAQAEPTGEKLLALALAYRAAGWLDDALLLAARAEIADAECAPEALALTRTVERFQALLDEIRVRVLAGYRGGEDVRLEDLVAALQRAAAEILGADPGPTRIEALGFFADRVDTTLAGQGLGRFFEAFGRFALLGQVIGGPVDVFAMREIHRRDLEAEVLGRPLIGNVVVGEAREISAFAEIEGPGIAGAAVHNGYFVNLDVVREWTLEIEELRRVHGTAARSRRLLEAPLPACAESERTDLEELLHVSEKLALRAALREGRGEVLQRLFELVSLHERAHLADAAEFLPLTRKPFAILGFLIAAGFSAAAVEARLELRAELTALAAAEEPDLVLSHIVSYAAHGRSGAHARGFRELLERFVAYLDENLGSFPRLDPHCKLVQQLHRLENEEIRRVALVLAEDEGLVGGG